MCSQDKKVLKDSLLTLVLMLAALFSTPGISADPLFTFCNYDKGTRNYTANSSFENNLNILLVEILPGNTSLTGFYNTSIGKTPDEVHGQALCRGDVNATTCQNCVAIAGQNLLKSCISEDAIIWYEFCQIHYSFQMFFGQQVYTGKYPGWNTQQKNISDPNQFDKALIFLMKDIIYEAAYNSSLLMFATGEVKFSRTGMVYGLAQCTRDISEDDCNNCLGSALNELSGCCNSRQGGMILSRNCDVRFELSPFYNSSSNLLPYQPSTGGDNWKTWKIVIVSSVPTLLIALLIVSCIVYVRKKRNKEKDEEKIESALLHEMSRSTGVTLTQQGELVSSEELPFMDLATIRAATNDFADSNKLGQGGFGTVYKGVLENGNEVAVKRLSKRSWQGLHEFKNEIILIARLQHRNLVRLLGCGIEGEEKLLIYEYMPNKSLDIFIFDLERRVELDWNARYNIICGIARGLLYLHEDSRLKIIHRDLKPSNVLLDHEMVAKISDFGMARIFGEDQNAANTRRVVGTYGYMAPEYAMAGLFSVKSDVFSFGVIVLEIISGKKNSGFYLTELAQTLLAYAWRLWMEGKELEFVDPLLLETCQVDEVVRCIHIGLLCVQQDPADRPTMSSIVVLLRGDTNNSLLPQPKQPAFSVGRAVQIDSSSTSEPSVNHITVSSIIGR